MAIDYKILDEKVLSPEEDARRDFALEVLTGLSEHPKRLSSRYLYDDRGSELFREIMGLEEYYLTGCERRILSDHGEEIVGLFSGQPFDLIDLGAGDGAKTMLLLERLTGAGADVRYVPIDISEGAMRTLAASVGERFPELEMHGLISEYFDGIRWLSHQSPNRRSLVLFLGSNIGNFDKPRARTFLRGMWDALRPNDYALIGFDLKKDIELLLHAYNDRHGVTAEFNLNLLRRINRELGGDFDLAKFRHFGTYDVFSGAMTSYLVSQERQSVPIEAVRYSFDFRPWEPIHMEYSYKYLDEDIESLAEDTGFVVEERFYDPHRYFVDTVWRVEKDDLSG
jgi:dimethylhistidine N-methyltransferase